MQPCYSLAASLYKQEGEKGMDQTRKSAQKHLQAERKGLAHVCQISFADSFRVFSEEFF